MERFPRSRRSRWFALLVLALIPGVARRVSAQAVPSPLTVRFRSTVGNAPAHEARGRRNPVLHEALENDALRPARAWFPTSRHSESSF